MNVTKSTTTQSSSTPAFSISSTSAENTSVGIYQNTRTTFEASSGLTNKSLLDVQRDNKNISLTSKLTSSVVTADQIIKNISSYHMTSETKLLLDILNQTKYISLNKVGGGNVFSGVVRKRNFASSLQHDSSDMETRETTTSKVSSGRRASSDTVADYPKSTTSLIDTLIARNLTKRLWYPAPPTQESKQSEKSGTLNIAESGSSSLRGNVSPSIVQLSTPPQQNYPLILGQDHYNETNNETNLVQISSGLEQQNTSQHSDILIESNVLTVDTSMDKLDLPTLSTIPSLNSDQNITGGTQQTLHCVNYENKTCNLRLRHKFIRPDTLMIFWTLCRDELWNLIIYNEVES